MALVHSVLKVMSLTLHLLCDFIIAPIETVAHKATFGCRCKAQNSLSAESPTEPRSKRKKIRNEESATNGCSISPKDSENDGKPVKLLVDITVRQVGSQNLDIKETTKYVVENENENKGQHNGFILSWIYWWINIPSSITLYITAKIRQLAENIESLENATSPACCDPNRIKKSPKRRISRANYRKIIPFFPFNLLGFSNYSEFQMPTFTGMEDLSKLNISNISANGNGKTRSKRRRHSTTGNSSSEDDFSHLELSEINAPPQNPESGHDEVDSNSDENPDGDAVTKPITSSSSPHDNYGVSNGKLNKGFKLANDPIESNNTSGSDMDSKKGNVGDAIHVHSAFYQELQEAANESYNSQDDPDYKPTDTSTDETSSYASGDTGESESFLKSASQSPNTKNIANSEGQEGKSVQHKTPSPSTLPLLKHDAVSNAWDEEYKTPEEEEIEEKIGEKNQF